MFMKKALVLAGGGTRGIYQMGAIEAMQDLGEDDWNMVFGVSVGALNAAMVVQHDYERIIPRKTAAPGVGCHPLNGLGRS